MLNHQLVESYQYIGHVAIKGFLKLASQEEVGREGIEPSWVAPGDFKSPASTISPPPQAGIGSLCA